MKRLAIAVCVLLGLGLFFGPLSAHAKTSSATQSKSTAHKASAKKKKRRSRREPKQKAPTPDRIMEIQEALARTGAYEGDPTGKWDAATVAGMHKFQSDHGLDSTGKIDALTLQKLGLGSDIAGVFAPRPVTPRTSPAPSSAAPADKQTPPKASSSASNVTQVTTSAPNSTTPTQTAPGVTPGTPAPTTPKPTSPPQPQ